MCELKGTPSGQVNSAGVVVYRNWNKYWNYSHSFFPREGGEWKWKNVSEKTHIGPKIQS